MCFVLTWWVGAILGMDRKIRIKDTLQLLLRTVAFLLSGTHESWKLALRAALSAPLLERPSKSDLACRPCDNGTAGWLMMGGIEIDLYFAKNFVLVCRAVL